jgi:DNA-binding response OmpR family regulator
MVPTLTRLGLLVGERGAVFDADAVATGSLLRHHVGERRPTPRVGTIAGMKVVVFSHDADTRAQVRRAIGRRPAADVPEADIVEVATAPALLRMLDSGHVDVMVLDGEAQPAGGIGVCRQAKDEIHDCPPVLLIIGRADDGWLATWSGADAVVSHPIDPRTLAGALAGLMRLRAGQAAPAQA